MACIVLNRCVVGSGLLRKLGSPLRSSITPLSFKRNFNTYADSGSSSDEFDRRDVFGAGRPIFFSGPLFPFSSPRRLYDILNKTANEYITSHGREEVHRMGRSPYFGYEKQDSVHVRVDMPGVGKENVKVLVDDGVLIQKGELIEVDDCGNGDLTKYEKHLQLDLEFVNLDKIKAEMKNGVLKISIPKVKQDERNVVEVKVD